MTEGVFAQIFNTLDGAGSVFLTKFAVILGAGPFQFGVLGAIGQLSQIFQPIGVILIRKRRERKQITLRLLTLGRLTDLLFGILPFLFPDRHALCIFIGLFMLSSSQNAIGLNTWIAWISDLIPLRIRGRFREGQDSVVRENIRWENKVGFALRFPVLLNIIQHEERGNYEACFTDDTCFGDACRRPVIVKDRF